MKAYLNSRFSYIVLLALALGAVPVSHGQPAPDQPAGGLPADIAPGSPLADVIKMVQAGVDASTVQTYIANCQSPFNLDADKILFLKDAGVPSDLINAMLDRDKALYAASAAPPPVTAPPSAQAVTTDSGAIPDTVDTAPPPADVDLNYFNDSLAPYGTWVDVAGYGRCWRPTVVIYDSSWRPYCDRGHWVYTDYGWYWDSDYAWGTTFHYGRWFLNPQFGWCWYPDTVWASSWVTFRSGGDYCGWAPLPPFAVFRPGAGFYYRGASVGVDFDFGLSTTCFTFVSADHFCDRRPRAFAVASAEIPRVYHQTTIINNFNVDSRFVANRGIPVDHITRVTHRQLEPVHVSALPNAGREGWRGAGYQNTLRPENHTVYTGNNNNNPGRGNPADNQFRTHQQSGSPLNGGNNNNNPGRGATGDNQLHSRPETGSTFNNGNNNNNNVNRSTTIQHQNFGTPVQGTQPNGRPVDSYHPQNNGNPNNVNAHVESQNTVHEPSTPVYRPATPYNGYTPPNNPAPATEYQNRNFRETAPAGETDRRVGQFQPNPNINPPPPAAESHPNEFHQVPVETVPHPGGNGGAQVQPQPQPRPTANGGNPNGNGGNGGNGNGNNGRGQNKQD
jgi:hypothetical protein